MIAFIESLDFRSQIRLETADLVKQERIAAEMIIKPTLSSATNIPSTIATTTLMKKIEWEVPDPKDGEK